jgi:hypothetical protein
MFKLTKHDKSAQVNSQRARLEYRYAQMTRDRRLDEVKAILRRLQHISVESVDPADAPTGPPLRALPHRAPMAARMLAAIVLLIGVGIYALISLVGSTDWTARRSSSRTLEDAAVSSTSSPRDAPPQYTPPSPQAVLRRALHNMSSGRVQAARSELLSIDPEGSVDVAWALARSYDPNFLSTLATADAAPDIAEATRWYRTWYALAVKEGLVADTVSPERIIRSMR